MLKLLFGNEDVQILITKGYENTLTAVTVQWNPVSKKVHLENETLKILRSHFIISKFHCFTTHFTSISCCSRAIQKLMSQDHGFGAT